MHATLASRFPLLDKGDVVVLRSDSSHGGWTLARVMADLVKQPGDVTPNTQIKAVEGTTDASRRTFQFDVKKPKQRRVVEFFHSRRSGESGHPSGLTVLAIADVDGNSVTVSAAQADKLGCIARHYNNRPPGHMEWWIAPAGPGDANGSDTTLGDPESESAGLPPLNASGTVRRRSRFTGSYTR